MCFLNLFHAHWNTNDLVAALKEHGQEVNLGQEFKVNLSIYDIRTRNKYFISPEQALMSE